MPLSLMLLVAQAAPVPAYPAGEVLKEFAAVCVGVDQADSGKARAIAAGWRETAPEPGSRLAVFLSDTQALLAKEMAEEGPATALPTSVLAKEVSGRSLALITSGVMIENMIGRGCRIYDFTAGEQIALEELKRWSGRDPNLYETREGLTRAVWNPGLKTGQMEMEVSFIAADATARKHPAFASLTGLVLTATAIDLTKE